jgi:hypothetical protein
MTHLHRHYVQHDECRFSGSSLRTYLVPGDWSNGIGVERGVCYVGEWQAAAVTARPLFQLSCYEQAFDARLAVSFAAAMLLNILGCKVVNGRAKDVSMVCWHCYSCRRHLFRCVIPAVTPGIGKHEPVQTSTGRRRCDQASEKPAMRDRHRKQSTLWLSFAEATRKHLFSQLRLNRQSGNGAGVRTIVGRGQDDRGPMRQRQPIAANIEPRVMSFKQPILRAVGNVVILHSSMPALRRITDSTRTSSVGPRCAISRLMHCSNY